MASGVSDLDDGGGGDELLEFVESHLAAFSPCEGLRGAGELMERVGDVGEVLNEGAVIVELLFSNDGENFAKVFEVGFEVGAKDDNIIKVDHDTNFEEVTKDVIHGRFKCGGGIGEFEGHHEELVVPEARAKDSLVGVLLVDADLVEATAEINLGEILGSTETIKKLGYAREWVLVLDHDPVQGTVVCAHAEFRGAVLLNEETVGSEGGGARLNEFFLKEFNKLSLHLLGLGDGELVLRATRRRVAELEINGVGYTALVMKLSVAPISRRVRNFTVNAPRETGMNLSWNCADPAQAEEIIVLRRRCSRPNLMSRLWRACCSTRSVKVVADGLGRRVEEHVAVEGSSDGIGDIVGRGAGGVDCDAWRLSGGIELVRGGGGGGVLEGDVVEEARAGRGRLEVDMRGFDSGGMVDDYVTAGVFALGERGGGVTTVEVVVDKDGGDVDVDVEAEACLEEGVAWGVEEGGVVVVTTVMARVFPSSVVTRSEMAAMVVLMESREDWRAINVRRKVASSGVAMVEVGGLPASSWAMLSTESGRRSDMLMDD
ncbi:hypothetical protein CBR_g39957 [Chara braunii]|uniref:Uncharacterized protein n=1 Tax=Chara braunii TaxID=69332 RepID=A0A388K1X3_CHABU|nr:hypothetical protein CBR_g39957 [Chara braunii]|eukprot:GBG63953.1 hypothetical protein CBR_g39957 [Chara braunii]